jgi:hypothetical protein
VRSKIEDEFDLALFPALLVLLEFLNRNAPVTIRDQPPEDRQSQ